VSTIEEEAAKVHIDVGARSSLVRADLGHRHHSRQYRRGVGGAVELARLRPNSAFGEV